MQNDDKDLLLKLQQGDKACFKQFFEEHYDRYLSFARGLLHDEMAAEDAVQEAFTRLWVRRESIDPTRSVNNFLLVIIRNIIYNYLRLRYNARRSDVPLPDVADASARIEDRYIMAEMEHRVEQIIDQMPPQRRKIFMMSRQEHLTNAEIARLLNISQRTVEKHIEQALRQLRMMANVSIVVLIMKLF